MKIDNDIIPFEDPQSFSSWLRANGGSSPGIWLRIYKKDSGIATITYAQALDEALCWGWIDGQKQKYDEVSFLQRFTPRRPKSIWSKTNTNHIARLISEGRMQPAGNAAVASAKADGRWDAAYEPASTMQVPEDFMALLAKNKKAKAFFENLSRANHYAIAFRLNTAKKPETREKRMQQLYEMMKRGEALH